MATDFLGSGWRFPIGLNKNSQVEVAHAEDAIQQSIWTILGTSPGERVMRPEFGCGIHDLVFGVNNAGLAGRVAEAVREALVNWEHRIDVLDVNAVADPSQANLLLIEINYQVRSTNSRFNLVYPFYLD